MSESEKDRILRLELLLPQIKESLEKMLETQESFTLLKIESENSKEFRKKFDDEVRKIVKVILDSRAFEQDIKNQIEEEVLAIFNQEKIRKDFDNKVDARIELKLNSNKLGYYNKTSAKIGAALFTIIVGILIAVLKAYL